MRRVLALSLVVLLAPAAGAQVPLGAAIAQAKAGLKAALAQEKAALAEAEAQLGAAIDTLATAAQAGPLTTELLEGVLPTWLQAMEDLGAAVVAARADACGAASDALQALAGGADLDGRFPTPFYFGGDGFTDDIERRTGALAARTLERLRKRADKATRAAAEAGVGLTFALYGPNFTLNGPCVFTEETALVSGLGAGCVMFAIGTSDLASGGDGRLLVGGQLSGFEGPVEVTVITRFDENQVTVTEALDEHPQVQFHFGGVIDDAGDPLVEGNWIVFLKQGGLSLDEVAASVP